MDYSQISVEAHENQCVDTSGSGDDDHVLNYFAPNVPERPKRENVIRGGEWYAENDKQQVGDSKVNDKKIGRGSHLLISGHDDHDKEIADETDDNGKSEEYLRTKERIQSLFRSVR